MKTFYADGHAVLALKALQKQFKQEDCKIDNGRLQAAFLSCAILDILDKRYLYEKYKPKLQELARIAIKNHFEPIQSLQCALQLAKYVGYEVDDHDAIRIMKTTLSLINQNGCAESYLPNAYADVRNMASAWIIIYLLLKTKPCLTIKNDFNSLIMQKINETKLFTAQCKSYSNAFAMSPCSEEHGGGFLLNVLALNLCQRVSVIFNLHFQQNEEENDFIFKLAQRNEMLFNGRPNKPECLCYILWSFGALHLMKLDSKIVDYTAMKNNILNRQFRMKPNAAEEVIIKMSKVKKLEDCESKQDFAAYLMDKYGQIYVGFIQAEDKPDLMHSYAALVGWHVANGGQFDFALLMKEGIV